MNIFLGARTRWNLRTRLEICSRTVETSDRPTESEDNSITLWECYRRPAFLRLASGHLMLVGIMLRSIYLRSQVSELEMVTPELKALQFNILIIYYRHYFKTGLPTMYQYLR